MLRAAGRGRIRIAVDCLLACAGIGVAVWRLAPTLATVDDLGARFAALHWVWVVTAGGSAAASLLAYGELQRRMLACAGADLPGGAVQAVNFVSNALAQTLPSAGSTAGAAYAAAAFWRRGVDTAVSVWAATVTALVSAATLVVIAPLLLSADRLLDLPVALALTGALALLCGAVWSVLWRPASLRWSVRLVLAVASHLPVVRRTRWVTGQPDAVLDAITARMAGLRPTPMRWCQFVGIALGSWVLDYAALAACVAATGSPVPWAPLAVGYLAVQSSIALQLTPAGTGPAEAGLLAALTSGGEPAAYAALAVVLYRAIAWLGLTSAGWVVFLTVARRRHHRPAGEIADGTTADIDPVR